MKRSYLVLALALGGLPSTSYAVVVGFNWTGVVTAIQGDPLFPPSPDFGGVGVGDPVSGSFVFDLDTPDLIPDNPTGVRGFYETLSQEIHLGTLTYTTIGEGGRILIDASYPDRWGYVVSHFISGSVSSGQAGISFSDFTPPILHLSDDSLRPPPDLADVDFADGLVTFGEPFEQLLFNLTSITPIPEPGTGVLVLAGLALLCVATRFRGAETIRGGTTLPTYSSS